MNNHPNDNPYPGSQNHNYPNISLDVNPRRLTEDLDKQLDWFLPKKGCCGNLPDEDKFIQLNQENSFQEYSDILLKRLESIDVHINKSASVLSLCVLIHCLNQNSYDINVWFVRNELSQSYQLFVVTLTKYCLDNIKKIKQASRRWQNDRTIKPLVCIITGLLLKEIDPSGPHYNQGHYKAEVLTNPDSMWVE